MNIDLASPLVRQASRRYHAPAPRVARATSSLRPRHDRRIARPSPCNQVTDNIALQRPRIPIGIADNKIGGRLDAVLRHSQSTQRDLGTEALREAEHADSPLCSPAASPRPLGLRPLQPIVSRIASADISTSCCGNAKSTTPSKVLVGLWSPKYSLWSRLISLKCARRFFT